MKPFFIFAALSTIFLVSCQETNFVINENAICDCRSTAADDPCRKNNLEWEKAVAYQQEIAAHDFNRGNYIGTKCQGEVLIALEWWPIWFNSWRPVDGYKHTLSATLDHFNWNYSDDEDWNLHCIPNTEFQFLIDVVEAMHSESKGWHKKCAGEKCMEGEISPDKHFWNNPWFFIPGASPEDSEGNGYSWLEGREMCFFGPWVMDANHDFKSEIHPVEMIWWKDHFENGFGGLDSKPFDVFWLMLLQDNTGRFDDRNNFDCDGDTPQGWEPWANSPISGQFNIAFEVDPDGPPVHFEIVEIFNRFVVTSKNYQAYRDADDGKEHALVYKGKELVKVKETQPNDNDLGVTFSGVCKRPDGKLQGFVSLRSQIGGNDDIDEEGFHILYVVRKEGTLENNFPGFDPSQIPDVMIQAKLEKNTILPDPGGYNTANIHLDFTVRADAEPEASEVIKVIFQDSGGEKQYLSFRQNDDKTAIVNQVPLLKGTKLIITFKSGKFLETIIPQLSLGAAITCRNINENKPTGSVWDKILIALKTEEKVPLSDSQNLLHSKTTALRVLPVYGVADTGNSKPENLTPATEGINRAIIKKERGGVKNFFLNEEPLSAKWTFQAKSLITGDPVPVNMTGMAKEDELSVSFFNKLFQGDSINVSFPPKLTNEVIECEATVQISDIFGRQTEQTVRFWNYRFILEPSSANSDFSFFLKFAGIQAPSLLIKKVEALSDTLAFTEPSGGELIDYAILSFFRNITDDKEISFGELRDLTGMSARLQSILHE
ncbi:MAG: hypothetical protein WA004_09710 [Saprospiraceae bacterium]